MHAYVCVCVHVSMSVHIHLPLWLLFLGIRTFYKTIDHLEALQSHSKLQWDEQRTSIEDTHSNYCPLGIITTFSAHSFEILIFHALNTQNSLRIRDK